MSEHSIDPDLRDRRLATLVYLLQGYAAEGGRTSDLTAQEAHEWAHQCRNLLGTAPAAPSRKKRSEVDPLLR